MVSSHDKWVVSYLLQQGKQDAKFLCQYSFKVSTYRLAQTPTLVNVPYSQGNNPVLSNKNEHALATFQSMNLHRSHDI